MAKLLHKKSQVEHRKPSASMLDFGEIAVNYNENDPFLSIRTSGLTGDSKVATFPSSGAVSEIISSELDPIKDSLKDYLKNGEITNLVFSSTTEGGVENYVINFGGGVAEDNENFNGMPYRGIMSPINENSVTTFAIDDKNNIVSNMHVSAADGIVLGQTDINSQKTGYNLVTFESASMNIYDAYNEKASVLSVGMDEITAVVNDMKNEKSSMIMLTKDGFHVKKEYVVGIGGYDNEITENTKDLATVIGDITADIDDVKSNLDEIENLIDVNEDITVAALNSLNNRFTLMISGATDAFDTLQEVETWINAHSSTTIDIISDINTLNSSAHSHSNKSVLDSITTGKTASWDKAASINIDDYAKKSDIATPNWNAKRGEAGYIKNRTHYDNLNVCALDLFMTPTSQHKQVDINYVSKIYVKKHVFDDYDDYYQNGIYDVEYGVITPSKGYGPFYITSSYDENGNEASRYLCITEEAYEDMSYVEPFYFSCVYEEWYWNFSNQDEQIIQLYDGFIPDTIARKSDIESFPIILGDVENSAVLKGGNNTVTGKYSAAIGYGNNISSDSSAAFGYNNIVENNCCTAEGVNNKVCGDNSHVEGRECIVEGHESHAEGNYTKVYGHCSHGEGTSCRVLGDNSHVEGHSSVVYGHVGHAEGQSCAAGDLDQIEKPSSERTDAACHAEGIRTTAKEMASHSEGIDTHSMGVASHAEGRGSYTSGDASHAEGLNTKSGIKGFYFKGIDIKNKKIYLSTTKPDKIKTSGFASSDFENIDFPYDIEADMLSIINGNIYYDCLKVTQIKNKSVIYVESLPFTSVAEFNELFKNSNYTIFCLSKYKLGAVSVSFGCHSEGYNTRSFGIASHADGYNTIAKNVGEHASGIYNVSNGDTQFSIGIGTSDTNRKNAFEVKQNGDIYVEGVEGKIQDKLNTSPDWNAQEGEPGFIENKPFFDYINLKLLSVFEVISKEYSEGGYADKNGIVTYQLESYGNVFPLYIKHPRAVMGVFNGYMITKMNPGDEIYECDEFDSYYKITAGLDTTDENSVKSKITIRTNYNFIVNNIYCHDWEGYDFPIVEIDKNYIPDTVLKTTPQTLSDTDKNQALVNLGIQDKLNEISQINKTIEDNELVISTTLNSLNNRVEEIENNGSVSQLATNLENYKLYLQTGGTVYNAQKIGNLTVGEILDQIGSTNAPTKNTSTAAYLMGINGDESYYSDIVMQNNSISAPNGFYQESDENLKTFISDIEVDLDKISELPKKYFMWRDNRDENIHIGTSAQAVEELYPELVKRDKKGDLTVDYSKLSIIALKAIDMLNEERKQMKEDIAAIKSKLGL